MKYTLSYHWLTKTVLLIIDENVKGSGDRQSINPASPDLGAQHGHRYGFHEAKASNGLLAKTGKRRSSS
jgi:hypothetical protein